MGLEFRSIYRHGFARVAACTTRTAAGRSGGQRRRDPGVARECHDAAWRWRCSPNWRVRLCDRGHAAAGPPAGRGGGRQSRPSSRESAELLPVLVVGAPLRHARRALQHRRGHPSRPAARRGAEDPSAELPRVLRAASVRHRRRHVGRRRSRVGGHAAPFGTDLLFAAEDLPGFVVHAEICEDIWVPDAAQLARPRWPARRCWPISRPATSPSARRRPGGCCAARNRRAAWPPISMPPPAPASRPPIWPGTARRRSSRTARCWPRPSDFPADASSRRRHRPRSAARTSGMRMGTLRHQPPAATHAAVPTHRLPARSAGAGHRLRAARSSASRSCPRTATGWSRIATRHTTSRSPAWRSGCARPGIQRW